MAYVRPDISGIYRQAPPAWMTRDDAQDRTEPVYGVVIHTTGSTLVGKALAAGRPPLQAALDYYRSSPYFAHYVVGYQGEIGQVADEHEKASHVEYSQEARGAFLDGSWALALPAAFVAAWRARWGHRYGSPAHLFPGPSVNNVTVGAELLPWQPGCPGVPAKPGLRYTGAQHIAAARLAQDIANRWGFPPGWSLTGRLAGHEDLNPLERVTKSGQGWDPGGIRPGASPWIDWGMIIDQLERPAVACEVEALLAATINREPATEIIAAINPASSSGTSATLPSASGNYTESNTFAAGPSPLGRDQKRKRKIT